MEVRVPRLPEGSGWGRDVRLCSPTLLAPGWPGAERHSMWGAQDEWQAGKRLSHATKCLRFQVQEVGLHPVAGGGHRKFSSDAEIMPDAAVGRIRQASVGKDLEAAEGQHCDDEDQAGKAARVKSTWLFRDLRSILSTARRILNQAMT